MAWLICLWIFNLMEKPAQKPHYPYFSSGPCAKPPGWSFDNLKNAALSRSHRSGAAVKKLQEVIDKSRQLLEIPDDYLIGIVPASDTGAVEMAMWCMLGQRGVEVYSWENFGHDWNIDAGEQLPLKDKKLIKAEYGELPDFSDSNSDNDIVFTWNGTTAGVRIKNTDWISDQRKGLTICDATSAVFSMHMDWHKLDVITYSWQKVLGSEAAHGMLILSPRAVERLETFTPPWPIPKIFRLANNQKLISGIFSGATINTPSMISVEDVLNSLNWGLELGGLNKLIDKILFNPFMLLFTPIIFFFSVIAVGLLPLMGTVWRNADDYWLISIVIGTGCILYFPTYFFRYLIKKNLKSDSN